MIGPVGIPEEGGRLRAEVGQAALLIGITHRPHRPHRPIGLPSGGLARQQRKWSDLDGQ